MRLAFWLIATPLFCLLSSVCDSKKLLFFCFELDLFCLRPTIFSPCEEALLCLSLEDSPWSSKATSFALDKGFEVASVIACIHDGGGSLFAADFWLRRLLVLKCEVLQYVHWMNFGYVWTCQWCYSCRCSENSMSQESTAACGVPSFGSAGCCRSSL
jgi:hypothetical protein